MSETVKYPMPKTGAEYATKLFASMEQSPEVRRLIEAAHHVLAGGKVEVSVIEKGDAARVAELTALSVEARRQSNDANLAAGTYVTLIP